MLGSRTGQSYMVGYGRNYPDRPHHRTASCSIAGPCNFEAFEADRPNPQVLLGTVTILKIQEDAFLRIFFY
jgi:hypothetical protein